MDDHARRWILVATILGSSMSFIDGSVVNLALPALQSEMHASLADVQWVVEAYLVVLGSLLLVGGALGDRYGRRTVYVVGIAVFTVMSAGCGLAANLNQLLASRALQGLGGALLVPGSLAVLSDVFAGEARSRAISLWSGFSSVTTAIGPVLGGYLVEHFSWRWAFLINLPIGAIVVFLLLRYMPAGAPHAAGKRLDVAGALCATASLAGLVFGLIAAADASWSDPRVWGPLGVALAAGAAFLWLEAHVETPMMPLILFTSRAFTGANLLTLLLYTGLTGTLFFLPLNLIQVQHDTPTEAGAATLPFVGCMVLLSTWAGRLADRHGSRLPLTVGPGIAALGFVAFGVSNTYTTYWTGVLPGVLLLGVGMAITVAPLTTTVMNSVEEAYFGVASGINNAVSRVASMVAIAGLGIVMALTFRHHLAASMPTFSAPVRAAVERQLGRLAAIEVSDTTARAAIDDAFVAGFHAVSLVCAGLSVLASGIAFVTLRKNFTSAEHAVNNRV